MSKDFFGIKDKDISKLNLIDRINIHYKHVPNVPFDNDELEWVEKANQTKTCDDVLNLAIELQEWMKQNQKDKTDEMFNLDIEMPQDEKDGIKIQMVNRIPQMINQKMIQRMVLLATMIHNLMVIQKMIQKKKHLVGLLMIKNQKKKKM